MRDYTIYLSKERAEFIQEHIEKHWDYKVSFNDDEGYITISVPEWVSETMFALSMFHVGIEFGMNVFKPII